MSLDPPLSDNELLRRKAERDARQSNRRWEVGKGELVTEEVARILLPPHIKGVVNAVNLTTTLRKGELVELSGVVHGPPRSKKNHKQSYAKESAAYIRYRNGIVEGMKGRAAFPPVPLNLAALFYVDGWGKAADLVGLLQGFCDALENAAVVPDDIWILGFDRSRKVTLDTSHPRVEFTLSHLPEKYL